MENIVDQKTHQGNCAPLPASSMTRK